MVSQQHVNRNNINGEQKPIPDHKIDDLESFNFVTGEPRQIAGLYFYLILDCLVDLAYAVSKDFFYRPYLYTDLRDPDIAPTLARLHARSGSDERIPDKEQRDLIFVPIFGYNELDWRHNEGDFPRLRNELLDAAAAFAERVYDTGVDMLRARVRTTHRPFREYLTGLLGDSIKWSREQVLPELTENIVYKILRNPGVNSVFGIINVPIPQWPYNFDSNGEKLVKEISYQLMVYDDAGMYITRERFSNLQRTALRGAEALATIVDFDEGGSDEDLNLLITKCYTWRAALMSLSDYSAHKEYHHRGDKYPMNGSLAHEKTEVIEQPSVIQEQPSPVKLGPSSVARRSMMSS